MVLQIGILASITSLNLTAMSSRRQNSTKEATSKPHFFHKSASYLHYDITAEQRAIAVAAGAIQVSSRELLGKAKEMTNANPS